MRSTRNTAKGTPPSAKKQGKGTPGKGTPKAKQDVKPEKEDTAKMEVEPVDTVLSTEGNDGKETKDIEMKDVKEPKVEDSKDIEKPEGIHEEEKHSEDQKDSKSESESEASKSVQKTETNKEEPAGEQGDHEENADKEGNAPDQEEQEEEEDEDGDGSEDEDEDEGEEELIEPRVETERQKRKKLEVFVGGLDKEATIEEVKKTFEAAGEVQEVRLMTNPKTGKNKGYAFVRFATAEQATKAATELDRTKIRDKECAVVPSEDNDTLFVGNICKTWSLDQVMEKFKEYGVEGIDEVDLVKDSENEGHNRGHAFLEFETHNDAIKAFKRLSKPDAIFGCDRSAKVTWAEASSEPDESVLAKVKSVFVSGTPKEWDNDKIKDHFGKFGDIERIVLAKNIPKSKRTDFAFVNYSTRDAAVAAIEAMNNAEITEGDEKITLKVELAKPATRKRRMKGFRGSFPVGGRPGKQGKGEIGRGNQKKGRMSSQKNNRDTRRKSFEERDSSAGKNRNRQNPGRRNATGPSQSRGRNRRGGPYSDDEYMPLGARISPGYMPARGYSGRRFRDSGYPPAGTKRPYTYVEEEAAYYGSGPRGYPRARVDYGDPALYSDPLRASSLSQDSFGYAARGLSDYSGYGAASISDPRRAAYPSYYSRASGYGGPSVPGPYY
ncbi:hypothetical protein KP509_20G007500 [Ceratopteris richardii]|uniref:RRM domain-containing protein n=1 Tax=Ceratopteris richardii TaxID=49495 RepID=A0A8T2SG80_CERRI|nr:hypothetical protein KP509_20G007500 [Ceratopteris richardii]